MTIQHHPSEPVLLDYASGALDEVWSLAVVTHLALCPDCRGTVEKFEALGGALLADAPHADGASSDLDAVMKRLDAADIQPTTQMQAAPRSAGRKPPILPEPLRSYAGGDVAGLPWRKLGGGASQLILDIPSSSAVARLLRIPAGRPVPEHSHRGIEMTVVLAGAFSDITGRYDRGDFQEADETLEHQPDAAAGEDCICLAVTDAPLRFKNLVARIAQPFLRI